MPETGTRKAKISEGSSTDSDTSAAEQVTTPGNEAEPLRRLLLSSYVELLDAITGPVTDGLDTLLTKLQAASARLGEVNRNSNEFLMGAMSALAEICELARHQKVPRSAAEVLLRRRDADKLLAALIAQGSITLTELGKLVNKQTQNLHQPLREMITAGLIRRDDIGDTALYSATILGKAALRWAEEEQAAAEVPTRTVKAMQWDRVNKRLSKQVGVSEVKASKLCTSFSRVLKGEAEKQGLVKLPGGGVIYYVRKDRSGHWTFSSPDSDHVKSFERNLEHGDTGFVLSEVSLHK